MNLLSYVRVQFNSAADGRPTMVEGQVVRRDAAGFGLEWRELTPAIVEACVRRSANDLEVKFPRLVFQRARGLDALPRLKRVSQHSQQTPPWQA